MNEGHARASACRSQHSDRSSINVASAQKSTREWHTLLSESVCIKRASESAEVVTRSSRVAYEPPRLIWNQRMCMSVICAVCVEFLCLRTVGTRIFVGV